MDVTGKRQTNPPSSPGRPLDLQEVEATRISRHSAREDVTVVSPTHRPPLPPGDIPGTHLCQILSRPQGHGAAGWVKSMEDSSGTIGNRTRDLFVL